jgi:acetyl-CoA carboxylase beta subunit
MQKICKNKSCKKPFETESSIKVYCSAACYHKGSRKKQKQYVCKHEPNTKCPKCERLFYKKSADPKVKRNFCDKCLADFERNRIPLDITDSYAIAANHNKDNANRSE